MITPKMVLRGKEFISSNRLRSVIYEESKKRNVINMSTGKPFTKAHIEMVLRGERENIDIEELFITLILERKKKREDLEKSYKKEFDEV